MPPPVCALEFESAKFLDDVRRVLKSYFMSSKPSASAVPSLSKPSGGASFKCPIAIKISGFNKEASGFVTYSLDLHLIEADCLFPVQSRSESSSWKLRRRYSEFFALHQSLNERDMFRNLLPPIPPKVMNIFGEAPQDVAADRKTELLQYISVVASNPLVYTTPEFCDFLEIQLREPISAEQMIVMLKASADKCGWLMKQGKYSLSGWKRRWFMLHSSFLLYFENESSPLNLGMINVSECTVIPGIDEPSNPSVDFSIYHPQKREFKLRCEAPQEMPEWCRTLTAMESKVKLDDFELLSVIGQVQRRRRTFSVASRFASHSIIQGTFGKVVRAKKKGTSDLYAIKILKKSHVRETAQIDHTLTERQVLQKVVHPYVVNLRSRPRFLHHRPIFDAVPQVRVPNRGQALHGHGLCSRRRIVPASKKIQVLRAAARADFCCRDSAGPLLPPRHALCVPRPQARKPSAGRGGAHSPDGLRISEEDGQSRLGENVLRHT